MKHSFIVITALPGGETNQILVRIAEYKTLKRAQHYMPKHIGWDDLLIAPGEYVRYCFLVGGYAGREMIDYFPSIDEWESTPRQNRREQEEILRDLNVECGYTYPYLKAYERNQTK